MDGLRKHTAKLDLLASSNLFLPFLLLISFAYFLLGCKRDINFYDEGNVVYGASRILNGDIPYRDFWTSYAPGQFYLLAIVFKLFGTSITVGRIVSVVINSIIVFYVYLFARKLLPRKYSLFSWFLILALFAKVPMYASALPTSLLFSLASCYCLMKVFETKQRRWMLLAGLLTGMATLFRHDIGFYTFVSQSVLIIFFAYTNLSGIQCTRLKKFATSLQICSILFAGTMVVLLPAVVVLVAVVGIKNLVSDLVIFPATIYPKFRATPYPWPCPSPLLVLSGELTGARFIREIIERVPFYIPVIFLVTAVHLVLIIRKEYTFSVKHWFSLLLLLLGITFFNYSRVRSDLWHVTAPMIPAVILLSSELYTFTQNNTFKEHTFLRKLVIFMVVMASVSFGRYFIRLTGRKLCISRSTAKLVALDVARARGIRIRRGKAEPLLQAVRYVQKVTAPDERIFVGNSRHDKIFANDAMFYFLTERHIATKYHDLHPGLVTTQPVQKQIVDDLCRNAVKCIILVDRWDHAKKSDKGNKGSGVTLLDDFIKRNYIEVESFGPYRILRINGGSSDGHERL